MYNHHEYSSKPLAVLKSLLEQDSSVTLQNKICMTCDEGYKLNFMDVMRNARLELEEFLWTIAIYLQDYLPLAWPVLLDNSIVQEELEMFRRFCFACSLRLSQLEGLTCFADVGMAPETCRTSLSFIYNPEDPNSCKLVPQNFHPNNSTICLHVQYAQ